ncbi:MAG: PEP-CTERM sorting domain-containing protein [Acidobacteria bacterium]|nr:PEP-CTERM sorting domain-containing protein [Acidobacteriota bacterium]
MKRLFSTFCLLVGASVASYAGILTGASGTNLLGPSAVLMDFGAPATFPVGSFTSLPAGTSNSSVSISVAGAGSGANNGSQARINPNDAGTSAFFGGAISGTYLSSYSGTPGTGGTATNQFARTITLTFLAPVTGFTIDYVGSQSSSHEFAVAGVAGITNLANQSCGSACTASGRQIGYVVDGSSPVSSFSSVSFTFVGTDSNGFGDDVLFDNIRTVAAVATSGSSATTGGNPVIPEPSTYALMGAGLLALGYARRKK